MVLCSGGGRIRTCDLQVMSLASYQLLHSAMLSGCKGTHLSESHQIFRYFFSKNMQNVHFFAQNLLFIPIYLGITNKNYTFAHQ